MAKTIKVDFNVDTSDVDKAQRDIDKLKMSSGTISTKVEVDTSDVENAEKKVDDLKKKSSVLDIKVNAETGEIDIVLDKTQKLSKQANDLRIALQNATPDSDEWIALNQKLGDVSDEMTVASVKSRELFGTISLLPGPFGEVANTLEGTIDTFKQLDAVSLKEVKANIAAFGNDLKGMFTTIGKLTGITKAYTVVNTFLSNSFGVTAASSAAATVSVRAFSAALIGTGIGVIIVALGYAANALMNFADRSDEAAAAQKRLDDRIKTTTKSLNEQYKSIQDKADIALLESKKAGESVAKQQKIREDALDAQIALDKEALSSKGQFASDLLAIEAEIDISEEEREKKRADLAKEKENVENRLNDNKVLRIKLGLEGEIAIQDDADKQKEDRARKQKEAADKRTKQLQDDLDKRKKIIEDHYARLKEIDARESAASDVNIKASRALLEDRLKEELAIEDAYEESRKTLLRANITDFTNIERERFAALFSLRKDYAQQDLDRTINDINNRLQQEKFLLDKKLADGLMTQVDYNNQLLELEKANNNAILAETESHYANLQNSLNDALKNGLITQSYYDTQTLILTQSLNDKKVQIYQTANGLILKGVENTNKAAEDELNRMTLQLELLKAQGQSLAEGTQAWYDNAIATENKAYEIRIKNAKDNALAIETIEKEHANNMNNIDTQMLVAKKEIEAKKFEVVAQFGNLLGQLAGKNKAIAKAAVIIEKAAAIGQIWSNNAIANAKATAVSPLTAGQPWVTINTIGAGISTAGVVLAAKKSIAEIDNPSGEGSSASTPSFSQPSAPTPSVGVSQNQTGVLGNIISSNVEKNNSKDRPIRTYVVQNDLRTEEQLNRRIRTAARLG